MTEEKEIIKMKESLNKLWMIGVINKKGQFFPYGYTLSHWRKGAISILLNKHRTPVTWKQMKKDGKIVRKVRLEFRE